MRLVSGLFRRRSIRTRYMLSYLLIMALPLVSLIWLLCDSQMNSLMKSVDALQVYRMEQLRDSFDTRLNDIGQISAQIVNEYKLQPNYMLSLRSHAMDAASLLSSYNSRNTLTHNVYLYLYQDKTIYANDGCMSLDAMTSIAYRMNNQEKELFTDTLQNTRTNYIQPLTIERTSRQTSSDTKMLMMLYPMRFIGGKQYGVLFYIIRQEDMLSIMRDALGSLNANVIIYNADGTLMAGTVPNGSNMDAVEKAVSGKPKSGATQIYLGNDSWSVIYSQSDKFGLNYATVYPSGTMPVQVIKQKMAIFQISSIILIVGIGISLIMAWLNYRPIHRLLNEVGLSARSSVFNELDAIKNSFVSILDRNKQLNQRVEKHASYMIEYVITLALEGNIDDREVFDMLGEERDCFPMPCFQVLALDRAANAKAGISDEMKQTILHFMLDFESLYRGKVRLFNIDRTQDGIIIILLNIDSQAPDCETNYGHILFEHLKRNTGELLLAGMGLSYEGISQIQKSFIESMAALESARFQRIGDLLIFNDFISSKNYSDYSLNDELQHMIQSIKQGNSNMACYYLGNIYNTILANKISSDMVRCNLFGIINTIVNYILELAPGQFSSQINNLMKIHSLDKFARDMRELIIPICEFIKGQQTSATAVMRDRLLNYVEEHYNNPEFSLECIADQFHLSTSFVSRIFSEQTNMSFKEHVSILRIEHAKRLLVSTDLPLHEIVLKVGYVNTSNFIKKFKLYTGKTPGDWRSSSQYGNTMSAS